jgi:hypothetical protein
MGENMNELTRRITEYAATIDEANKRTLDPIIIELMRDRTDIETDYRSRDDCVRLVSGDDCRERRAVVWELAGKAR